MNTSGRYSESCVGVDDGDDTDDGKCDDYCDAEVGLKRQFSRLIKLLRAEKLFVAQSNARTWSVVTLAKLHAESR